MFRRLFLVLLEIVAGLLAMAVLAGGVAAWRLTQGPLQVDALTPYLEQAINRESPVRVDFGGTRLSWAGFGAPLDIQAVNFTAFGESGQPVLRVPEIRLSLSLPALLRQRIAPTRVELVRPTVAVVRTEEGEFRLDLPTEGAADPDAGRRFTNQLIQALRDAPDPREPFGALQSVRIVDATLMVENQQLDVVWTAPNVELTLIRNAAGLSGSAALDVDLGGRLNRIEATLDYRRADGQADVELRFADIQIAQLAQLAPVLEPLRAVDVALYGVAQVRVDREMEPRYITLRLAGGSGRAVLPELLPEPLGFEGVFLEGRLEDDGRRLVLDRFAIDLGRPELAATGTITRRADAIDTAVTVEITDLPMAELPRLWPAGVKDGARSWMIDNLAEGTFDRTSFTIEGRAPTEAPLDLTPSRIDGRFAFSGFSIRYMETLPPVTAVAGTASFDGRAFDIALSEGRLLDLKLAESSVRVFGLDTPNHAIDIRIPFSGPVSSALAVLDHEPLRYAAKVNLVPKEVGGTAEMEIHFAFPLLKDLKFDDVRMKGTAKLVDVSASGIVPDVAGTDGRFDLTVTNDGLEMVGTALLNGVTSEVDWREDFRDRAAVTTRVAIKARPDDAGRAAFDLDFPDWVRGTTPVDLVYQRTAEDRDIIDAEVDLTPATLLIDIMGWEKPPGARGRGEVRVEFIDGKPVSLPRFKLVTEEMQTEGRARLRPTDYGIERLELDRFTLLEATDIALVLESTPDGAQSFEVTGRSFDARPLRADDEEPPGGAGEEAATAPLAVRFALDRVVMGDEGQQIRNATGSARNNGRFWDLALVEAAVGEAGRLIVQYQPDGETLALTVESDDAGAALRELDILRHVRGGALLVTGRSDPRDPGNTVAGRIELRDYQVQDAPALARLLSAASPRGFANFLGGQPIAFSRLVGQFRWHERGISLREVQTSGSAVGLTAEGDIDLDGDTLALQGTVVPFSTFNRLVGAIPLVGDLLVGGEGQGLFAATYTVSGKLAEPDIGVNPLAVLAPGFLRNLFFMEAPAGEGGAVPENLPAPTGKMEAPAAPTAAPPAAPTAVPPAPAGEAKPPPARP